MCVVSMVFDHYKPKFPPEPDPGSTNPFAPILQPGVDLAELRKLIDEFKEAVAAARKVDALTHQGDCEDPEKAKLEGRVAALEKQVAALHRTKAGLAVPSRQPQKSRRRK